VKFTVSSTSPNQVTLFLNGTPVSEGTFGRNAGNTTNYGQVLLSIPANGVLTLRNYLTTATVTDITLVDDPGGDAETPPTANNTSILIEKIG